MAGGREGYVAIGREVVFGTSGAREKYFNATEGIEQSRDRLREFRFGSRSRHTADAGRTQAEGAITDIYVRADTAPELLRAALGISQDGLTYSPSIGQWSENAALPPYSIFVSPGENAGGLDEIIYSGAQARRLELSCEADGALIASVDWLVKEISEGTFTPGARASASSSELYTFNDLQVRRDGVLFPYVEAVTITTDNDVQPVEVFNQDDTMVSTAFESPALIDVQMRLTFRDRSTYDEFVANTKKPWSFRWASGGNLIEASFPQLSIDRWGAPINTPGRLTVDVYAVAEEPDDGRPAVSWMAAAEPPLLFVYDTDVNLTRNGSNTLTTWNSTNALYPLTIPASIATITDPDGEIGVVSSGSALTANLPLDAVGACIFYAVVKAQTGTLRGNYFEIIDDGVIARRFAVRLNTDNGIAVTFYPFSGASGTQLGGSNTPYDQRVVVSAYVGPPGVLFLGKNTSQFFRNTLSPIPISAPSTSRQIRLLASANSMVIYQAGFYTNPTESGWLGVVESLKTRYGIT